MNCFSIKQHHWSAQKGTKSSRNNKTWKQHGRSRTRCCVSVWFDSIRRFWVHSQISGTQLVPEMTSKMALPARPDEVETCWCLEVPFKLPWSSNSGKTRHVYHVGPLCLTERFHTTDVNVTAQGSGIFFLLVLQAQWLLAIKYVFRIQEHTGFCPTEQFSVLVYFRMIFLLYWTIFKQKAIIS